jgi:hypothetical protein
MGGRRGIIVNSEALCARPRRAEVTISAQSGKRRLRRPSLRADCGDSVTAVTGSAQLLQKTTLAFPVIIVPNAVQLKGSSRER